MAEKIVPIALCAIVRNVQGNGFELFLQKREEDGPLNGLLELPGGKVEEDELPQAAAERELNEETGSSCEGLTFFKHYDHKYSDRRVFLNVFLANGKDFNSNVGEFFPLNYERPEELIQKMPAANKDILDDLSEYLKAQGEFWN